MNEMNDLLDDLLHIPDDESEEPVYIIVDIPAEYNLDLPDLTESQWKQKKRYRYRIDPPDPTRELQRHIHISNKQHLTTKSKQVSWNVDGSRHDRSSFNSSMSGIEKAKKIARDVLNLDPNIVLEKTKLCQVIIESIQYIPDDTNMFSLTLIT